jgi:hypothetical protein
MAERRVMLATHQRQAVSIENVLPQCSGVKIIAVDNQVGLELRKLNFRLTDGNIAQQQLWCMFFTA